MRYVTAREIMTVPVITLGPDAPVREIAALMLRLDISGVPVVDDGMHLLGIVTAADLIRKEGSPLAQPGTPSPLSPAGLERLVEQPHADNATTARDLMTTDVVTAGEDARMRDLAHLMLTRNINRVPVLRDERLVGIVTRADVLKVFVRGDDALVETVRDTLANDLQLDPTGIRITCQNGVVTVAGAIDRGADRALAIKWIRSVDGVVGVNADAWNASIDDRAAGRIVV